MTLSQRSGPGLHGDWTASLSGSTKHLKHVNQPSADQAEREYYNTERKIKCAITRAKNAPNREQKIKALQAAKDASEELRQHRLRYFDLVP